MQTRYFSICHNEQINDKNFCFKKFMLASGKITERLCCLIENNKRKRKTFLQALLKIAVKKKVLLTQ